MLISTEDFTILYPVISSIMIGFDGGAGVGSYTSASGSLGLVCTSLAFAACSLNS